MKNTFLKKAGAVALAAVMAVTFAPVASLNVFAAGNSSGDSLKNAKPIDEAGVNGELGAVSYYEAVANTTGAITVKEKKSVTLDVAGKADYQPSSITLETGASLTIVDSKGTTANDGTYSLAGTVTFDSIVVGNKATLTLAESLGGKAGSDATAYEVTSLENNGTVKMNGGRLAGITANTGSAITIAGGHIKNTVTDLTSGNKNKAAVTGGYFEKIGTLKNTDGSKIFTGAVASLEDYGKSTAGFYGNVAVGSAYIDKLNFGDANPTLYALSGNVTKKDLGAGKNAVTSTRPFYGDVTLKATAAKDTSLAEVKTAYSYKWVAKDNVTGTGTYTHEAFYAGADNATTQLKSLPAPLTLLDVNTIENKTGRNLKTDANGGRPTVNYDRAITVTVNDHDNDALALESLTGDVFESYDNNKTNDGINAGTPDGVTVRGITYFTADPSAYTTTESAIVVVDSTKYVIGDDAPAATAGDEIEVAARAATKTIDFKRLGGYDDTNKDSKCLEAFAIYDPSVKVTAPADTHVASATTKNVVNGNAQYYVFYNVAGAAALDNQYKFGGITSPNTDNSERSIYVSQVAKDSLLKTVEQAGDVTASAADGIEYYSRMGGSAKIGFTFGSAADAKAQLSKELSGYTENGITVDPITDKETIYITKGIKGTFKGVKPAVVLDGEVSEDVKVNADGTKDWTINEGYTSDAVPAYRMYRKSGEHVYTISAEEVKMLETAGWINEGTAFYVNPVVSKKGTPVYRVYNKNNGGMHFYTASAAEKDMLLANGWTEGAVVFYGADKATGIPVYRTYNTGSNNGEHNYTTNIAESDMNVKAGWRAEGVAFYVFK